MNSSISDQKKRKKSVTNAMIKPPLFTKANDLFFLSSARGLEEMMSQSEPLKSEPMVSRYIPPGFENSIVTKKSDPSDPVEFR
jgi:hypothetical protein